MKIQLSGAVDVLYKKTRNYYQTSYYNFIPINERYRFRQFSLWNVKLNS